MRHTNGQIRTSYEQLGAIKELCKQHGRRFSYNGQLINQFHSINNSKVREKAAFAIEHFILDANNQPYTMIELGLHFTATLEARLLEVYIESSSSLRHRELKYN